MRKPVRHCLRVEYVIHEIIEAGFGEGIIHDPVVFVAAKPGVRIVPVFRDENDIRLRTLDLCPEPPPEHVGNFVRHVQTPAVDPVFFDPIFPDGDEIFLRGGRIRVNFGHIGTTRKMFVIPLFRVRFIAADEKPVVILRFPALFDHIAENRVLFAAMVENGVEDNAHPARVRLGRKAAESLVAAKHGIDAEIVADVVFVVGTRLEYRREVQRIDAQFLQIVELLPYSVEVAPRKAFRVRNVSPFQIDVFLFVLCIPYKETLDKYLIDDRLAHPRYLAVHVARVDIRALEKVEITQFKVIFFRYTVFRKIEIPLLRMQKKNIRETGIRKRHLDAKIVEKVIRAKQVHRASFPLFRPFVFHRIDDVRRADFSLCRAQANDQLVV